MKICHIITGLGVGGAETVLSRLLLYLNKQRYESSVVSLTGLGPIGIKIQSLGINVKTLEMRNCVSDLKAVGELISYLKKNHFDLVQTWMYHANLIGGIAARLSGGVPVVWGLQHGNTEKGIDKRATLRTVRLSAVLSHWLPATIICCSEATRKTHIQYGYCANKMKVIINGCDLKEFKPERAAREFILQELKLSNDTLLIGMVARFHPQKDHDNFIKAAEYLSKEIPEAHFILVGRDITQENKKLLKLIEKKNLKNRIHLLGERNDVPRITAGLDIATLSSSSGEGWPNVLGEAMACGIPCVVTDIGDSASIVGKAGEVVPTRNPKALANAWEKVAKLGLEERKQLGVVAKQKASEKFSFNIVVKQYEKIYEHIRAL